ncbi:MFS transporter [Streptomyces sp. NRRL F-2664]|uniref:MFS transporter n=1 Tax=Streptomyces sp. NRRL F-2664 TaxID=1463842 RepID=UPI00131C5FEB|nr:MFS transporter [Streptomyces sp. NRRL F-2664]
MTIDGRRGRRRRWGVYVLLGGVAVASVGEAMMVVAVPWFVLQTTGSVAQTGFLVALGAVASAAVGFVSGPLVDRWGFRATAAASYAVGGIGAACIPVVHALGALDFPVLAALVVAANALDVPATAAVTGLVPELSADADMPLERGNALLGGVHQVAQLCGPPLGGAAVALFGVAHVLLVDAAACLAAAALVAGCITAGRAGPRGARAVGGYLVELRSGLRLLREHRLLRAVALSGTAFNGLDSGLAGVVLVTYAYQHLGSAASLGVLLTAFGLGAVAGTVGYAVAGHRLGARRTYLGAGFGVALLVGALAALPSLTVGAVLLALLGAFAAPVGPVRTAVLQRSVPHEQYGRVTTAVDTAGLVAVPLGASLTVVLVGAAGLRPALVTLACAYLLVVCCCWAAPALRGMQADRSP